MKTFSILAALTLTLASAGAHAERVKDLASVAGVRVASFCMALPALAGAVVFLRGGIRRRSVLRD